TRSRPARPSWRSTSSWTSSTSGTRPGRPDASASATAPATVAGRSGSRSPASAAARRTAHSIRPASKGTRWPSRRRTWVGVRPPARRGTSVAGRAPGRPGTASALLPHLPQLGRENGRDVGGLLGDEGPQLVEDRPGHLDLLARRERVGLGADAGDQLGRRAGRGEPAAPARRREHRADVGGEVGGDLLALAVGDPGG